MTDHELSRRDALVALSVAGVATAGLGALGLETRTRDGGEENEPALTRENRETLFAVAETVYPSDVDGLREFVETYVGGRVADDPERGASIGEAATALEEYALDREGERFASLSVKRRDGLLREMGVHTVDPDPDGIEAARVRYHLVNELLFALYTSPTGGRLVGIENPQGYPGGTDSYRRGPGE